MNPVTGRSVLIAALSFSFGGCVTSTHPPEGQSTTVQDSLTWLSDNILSAPNDAQVYIDRGEFHLREGNRGAALEDFALAIKADSTRLEIRQRLGEMRFDIQDFEGAVREWEATLQTQDDFVPSLLSLAKVDLLLRAYDPALKRINNALRVDDKLDEAYFLKGRLYLETQDTVTAVSSFQTAIEVNPNRYDAFIQLGLLYASAHDDLALEYFNTARAIRPNSIEAIYDQAIFLQEHGQGEQGRYRAALELYDRILFLDETNASAAFNKGFVFLEYLNQYDSAEFWFDQAIVRLPYYHQAHYNRGLCLESQGKMDAALSAYNSALELEPAYTPAALAKGRVLSTN